jgi:aminotransferase EvaB
VSTSLVKESENFKVSWSYLPDQFCDIDQILSEFRKFVPTGDFTLGKPLQEFEKRFAKKMGTKHAIGVNSGTDAIKLSLKAQGVGFGDEVITTANTFIATVGAINEIGAKTVFVDCTDDFCMDISQIEAAISPRTKAIVAVHLTGQMSNMPEVLKIAQKHNLIVVEDACQAMFAEIDGKKSGTFAKAGCFSLHPLKAINVWGDGGVVVTNDDDFYNMICKLRNHGLKNRDEVEILGYNSRLDTLQAIVGNWLFEKADWITGQRVANAAILDAGLKNTPQIRLPMRYDNRKLVYHLYIVFAERRDELLRYCLENGIEAKVHYPVPLYQQQGLAHLGYKAGAFPVTDKHAQTMISFPMHQHHTPEQMQYVVDVVNKFYK